MMVLSKKLYISSEKAWYRLFGVAIPDVLLIIGTSMCPTFGTCCRCPINRRTVGTRLSRSRVAYPFG